ncbi:glycerophosphodiester phosphodiesterase family protein [Bacillus spongiae]|uniref:Glycerophosphodiester phosphodiesterase family protein n=1 Tax=Bacillus spongiae TaxID=2683610 RepID=A0ABU8HFD2_9BACI
MRITLYFIIMVMTAFFLYMQFANIVFQNPSPFTKVIAHRGASGFAPENTLAAFDLAVEMKADYIELDLQMSKDGELIVIHDPSVERTTNGSGLIQDLTYEEILQFDAGSWFHQQFSGEKVPTLKEVLDRYVGEIGLLIELKEPYRYPGIEQKLAMELTPYLDQKGENSSIVVQSFDIESVQLFHEYAPTIPIGIVISKDNFQGVEQLSDFAIFADFISPSKGVISNRFIQTTEMLELETYPWTIKNQEMYKWLYNIDVNGIITDYPNYENKSERYMNYISTALIICLTIPFATVSLMEMVVYLWNRRGWRKKR